MCMKKRYVVGIDEVGRGPLAGPVAVGVAVIPLDFDWGLIPGVNDSKKLTPAKREEIYLIARKLQKERILDFRVSMVSAAVIDRFGIVRAIRMAIDRSIVRLCLSPNECAVKLDGGLQAPQQFFDQETIIKGDLKEKAIGLASIVAKVTRDRYMINIDKKYPQFSFKFHKGYGTLMHRNAILECGLSDIHRKSFCKNFAQVI